jgi:hypothetical protein
MPAEQQHLPNDHATPANSAQPVRRRRRQD